MFCTKCGAQIENDNSSFCTNCGAVIEKNNIKINNKKQSSERKKNRNIRFKHSFFKKNKYVVIGAVTILVVAATVGFSIQNKAVKGSTPEEYTAEYSQEGIPDFFSTKQRKELKNVYEDAYEDEKKGIDLLTETYWNEFNEDRKSVV